MSKFREKHDAVLAQSLENTDKFGDPFTLQNDGNPPTLTYSVKGKVSINTAPHKEGEVGVVSRYARFVVRYSTIATAAGRGTDPSWLDNMPKEGWTITAVNPTSLETEVFIMEQGSIFPNYDLGIITYVPASVNVEVAP